MGNGLSVSSIVDGLHALKPEERSEAFDKLCQQHKEIKTYLKSKYHEDLESPQQAKPGQPHLQPIHVKESVPGEQRLTAQEYNSWSKDISVFWTTFSYTFVPKDTSGNPIGFIYHATVQLNVQSHRDCLRRRYLALFWFDYFEARYPGRKGAYDHEYVDLGRTILGSATADTDEVVSTLRQQVKAGRKYGMLTAKFGDGILLTLPSSIGPSTLEKKLPLDQKSFDAWISPLVDSTWVRQANEEGISSLGRRIRQSLLQESSENQASDSGPPTKRRKTNTTPAVAQSRDSSIAAESPTTPPTLPQVYSIGGCLSSGRCNTDQTSRYCSEGAFHQCFLESAVTKQSTDSLGVTHVPDTSSSSNRDLRAPSAQADRCSSSPPKSDAGNLMLEVSLDAAASFSLGHEANNPVSQGQDMERASQDAPSIEPNQSMLGGHGGLTPLATPETIPSRELGMRVNQDTENEGINRAGPMLSNLSAADWGNCETEVFRPVHFQPDRDRGLFQPVHFQPDRDRDFFPPVSFQPARDRDLWLETSTRPL